MNNFADIAKMHADLGDYLQFRLDCLLVEWFLYEMPQKFHPEEYLRSQQTAKTYEIIHKAQLIFHSEQWAKSYPKENTE